MTAALLLIVAIAYLGGAFLVVAALAKALTTWSASWRARSHVAPVDEALQAQAAAAMAAVAARANVVPPATDVVAYLEKAGVPGYGYTAEGWHAATSDRGGAAA